jgi:hypothetical protein
MQIKSSTLKKPNPTKSLFINLLTIAVSLFVAFVFIEVCYRIYSFLNPPLIVETLTGNRFSPNVNGIYRGGKISTDNHGFRNGIDIHAWDKKKKIMLIGDSVGFGMGIDDKDTISHQLNEAFKGTDVGFLNLCNPGWDTIQLRDRLFFYGTKLKPWELVVWLYSINDAKLSKIYLPPDYKTLGVLNLPLKTLPDNFFIFRWPDALRKKVVRSRQLKNKRKDTRRKSWNEYYKWCISTYETGTVTKGNEEVFVHDIVLWAQQNESNILFVIFPAETQFADNNKIPQDFIKSLGEKNNFPVIDLLPYLSKAHKKERIFLEGDHSHLNPRGMKLVSDILQQWLIKNRHNLK